MAVCSTNPVALWFSVVTGSCAGAVDEGLVLRTIGFAQAPTVALPTPIPMSRPQITVDGDRSRT